MFDTLSRQPSDPLLALIGVFGADHRAGKIDLGVGVYRDEAGQTPIFRAVKAAEQRLWQTQASKAYLAPEGDHEFLRLLWDLVAGAPKGVFASGVQTPGGSGALRLAAELIARAGSGRVWLGLPSWPNHAGIISACGLTLMTYPYFDAPSQTVLFDRMVEALSQAEAGDVVLLHAGCHNPTGARLSAADWRELSQIIARRGLIPLIDIAYQGFGAGLLQDAAGLRQVIQAAPESLIAVSCSKSFGLYRERTGALFAVGASAAKVGDAQSHLVALARVNYSMPPDHGAAIVRTILSDEALKQDWMQELEAMRQRLVGLRQALASRFGEDLPVLAKIAEQEGMFSLLPLSEVQVLALRETYGVYMPTSGRINIAGLRFADVERVAQIFEAI